MHLSLVVLSSYNFNVLIEIKSEIEYPLVRRFCRFQKDDLEVKKIINFVVSRLKWIEKKRKVNLYELYF